MVETLKSSPRVSIVVVARNEEAKIQRCIYSIANQKEIDKQDFEIILVDDGSTDETVHLAKEVFPDIRVISNPVQSISKNRNKGWLAAKADYVAYLDADCEASEYWLANLLAEIESSDYAAVGGSNTPPDNYSSFYSTLKIMLNTYVGSRGSVQGTVYTDLREVEHLPGLNVMFNKTVLEKLKGYDQCFALVGEDEDLSIRIRYSGYKLLYVPNANVIHYQRDNYTSWMKNMFTYGKGRVWLIMRHPSAFSLVILLPVISVFLFPVYFLAISIHTFFICLKKQCLKRYFGLNLLYMATHISYGAGEIFGLFARGDTKCAKQRNQLANLWGK